MWGVHEGTFVTDNPAALGIDIVGNVYTVGVTLGSFYGTNGGLEDYWVTRHRSAHMGSPVRQQLT